MKTTISKIKIQANLEVSIRTVHRAVHENKYQYMNGKTTLLLNKKQNAERVRLCSDWLVSPPDWKKVVFKDEESDEKFHPVLV